MLKRFFSNPIVGFLGTIASIIGVLLAIYFYKSTKEIRELTYYVHPIKAQIVKSGQASQLLVKYLDNDIKSDVSAAQIAFWNRGSLSIRKSNILKPFAIRLEKNTPILEASIRKTSRDVIQLSLDQSKIKQGLLTINWEILEKNDGGIIQVIYAGSPEVNITTEGIIEGQTQILKQEFPGTIKSINEQISEYKKERFSQGIVFSSIGMFILLFGVLIYWYGKKRPQFYERFNRILPNIGGVLPLAFLGYSIVFIILGLYFLFTSQWEGPPFGM